jgi:hypothetical protein
LDLEECDTVCYEYTAELVAAAPQLVVINRLGNIVGGMKKEQLETAYKCSKSENISSGSGHWTDKSEDCNCNH